MNEYDDLCCPVCLSQYSERETVPVIIHCGHTQCADCLRNIFGTNKKCAECRSVISKQEVNSMTVNYSVLRIISSLKAAEEPQIKDFKLLEERIAVILQNLNTKKRLYNLRLDSIHAKVERINVLESELEEMRSESQKGGRELLQSTSLFEIQQRLEKTKNVIDDLENKFLRGDCRLQLDLAEENFLPLLEKPQCYYIRHKGPNNTVKYSSVSVNKERIFMKSCRKIAKLDDNIKYIEMEDIYPYTSGAFMCVESGGTNATLELELYCSRRAEQFMKLCIGDKGPCLKGTHLFNPNRIGLEGENISAGDYERNNGKGGSPLLDNLDSGMTGKKNIKSGLLVGVGNGTVFQIYLEDWPPKYTDNSFGNLLIGRSYLKSAVRSKRLIKIIDCGLIFDYKKKVEFVQNSNDSGVRFMTND